LNISGVGEMKKRKYGKEFMKEIQKFIKENE
jgi:superfamily II DNA helicase RecQ